MTPTKKPSDKRSKKADVRPRPKPGEIYGEGAVLTAIGKMTPEDRSVGERLHAIIRANAPNLAPRTWYGMPAYEKGPGEVVCFFRDRQKFKERYMSLGFNDSAHVDEGGFWPVVFALTKLDAATEARIADLVKRAVS